MWYEILYRILSIINYVVLIIIGFPLLIQVFNVLFCWVKKRTYPVSEKKSRIAYLIPAHNEADVIATTVKDVLNNQDYAHENYDVFVVADNCTDDTAKLAKAAGAIVLIHNDPDPAHHMALYPLKYGIDHILKLNQYDLVVHLDADNHISPNFSRLMNDAYQCGYDFLRPYEGSLNGPQNFYTKACTMFYSFDSRYGSRMRERIGVSAHVNGGGATMSTRLLKETGGYDCVTISDDAEFCFNRILEGRKAHFVEDAVVYEDMPSTLEDTVNRNKRIGSGGVKLLKTKLSKMFFGFFKTGRLSYMEMFLTYIFLFITPLLCIWMPLFYIYDFTFLALVSNGTIEVGFLYSQAYYTTVLFNTIWGMVGVLGGLFVLFGFVQAIVLVLCDYQKLGAKKRREMLDAGFLFPAYLFVYAVTICTGTLSKPKWKDVNRNVKENS
ncbi:MAG: glycosyltransferase [Bacilli bacterium]|nr:glycosyltransferase [Bacilli bacterium]